MRIKAELGDVSVEADIPDDSTPETITRYKYEAEYLVVVNWTKKHSSVFMTQEARKLMTDMMK